MPKVEGLWENRCLTCESAMAQDEGPLPDPLVALWLSAHAGHEITITTPHPQQETAGS